MVLLTLFFQNATAQKFDIELPCADVPCTTTVDHIGYYNLIFTGVVRSVIPESEDPLGLFETNQNWVVVEVSSAIRGSIASGWIVVAPRGRAGGYCKPGARTFVAAELVYPSRCATPPCEGAALGDIVASDFSTMICEESDGTLTDSRHLSHYGNQVCFDGESIRHTAPDVNDEGVLEYQPCPEGQRRTFDELVAHFSYQLKGIAQAIPHHIPGTPALVNP
jgi:hypothetical protein